MESLYPSPVKVLQSNPASLHSLILWEFLLLLLDPRLGSLMWSSESSLQWVDFCVIVVLQFVSHPPSGYGIWFYCDCAPPTISLLLFLCLWMWGIFFGKFQYLPVNDFSAVSCDSGALARESATWLCLCGSIFGLSILFRWSIHLIFGQYHMVLTTVDL